MSLFNMCCPKKPKMTLDYVIKWVGETDKTLKELVEWKNAIDSDIESLVQEAVENYDWSDLPQEALDHKADKVQEATEGNFAALDGNGNLTDSGYKASNFADANHSHNGINLGGNVANHFLIEETGSIGKFHVQLWDSQEEEPVFSKDITADMLNNTFDPATAPAQGNQKLITSGAVYTALQGKADSEHSHNIITNQASGGRTALFEVDATSRTAMLELNNKSAEINMGNIDNLNRALRDPSTTPEDDGTKLITSKAVYDALADHEHKYIDDKTQAGENAKVVVYAEGDGDPQILLSLRESSNSQPKTATVDLGNINNLIRALKTPELAADPNANTKLVTFGKVVELLTYKADADKISYLPDITLLVLKLAASAGIENLSWDIIDSNAHYYGVTSLTVNVPTVNFKVNDVCKVSDGTTTIYAKITDIDSSNYRITFNNSFTSMSGSASITVSKL